MLRCDSFLNAPMLRLQPFFIAAIFRVRLSFSMTFSMLSQIEKAIENPTKRYSAFHVASSVLGGTWKERWNTGRFCPTFHVPCSV